MLMKTLEDLKRIREQAQQALKAAVKDLFQQYVLMYQKQ